MRIDWHNLRILADDGSIVADLSAGACDWRRVGGRDPVVDERLRRVLGALAEFEATRRECRSCAGSLASEARGQPLNVVK